MRLKVKITVARRPFDCIEETCGHTTEISGFARRLSLSFEGQRSFIFDALRMYTVKMWFGLVFNVSSSNGSGDRSPLNVLVRRLSRSVCQPVFARITVIKVNIVTVLTWNDNSKVEYRAGDLSKAESQGYSRKIGRCMYPRAVSLSLCIYICIYL